MKRCLSVSCPAPAVTGRDFCTNCESLIPPDVAHQYTLSDRKQVGSAHSCDGLETDASSGGDNDYWVAHIHDPKRLDPYSAEAEDLIEHFQFSFAEGNAFKALWRMGMDRVASGKPGDTPLRNAEKVAYYGERMVVAEQRKLREAYA